jgi:outer membrane protein assembly factor BamB
VHAYSVNSGERLWRFKFSSDFTIGSEALDGNLLAIWGKDRLIVIDASAGKIAWTAELPSQPDVVAINEDAIAVLSKKTIASFDRLDGRLLSVQPADKAEMVASPWSSALRIWSSVDMAQCCRRRAGP